MTHDQWLNHGNPADYQYCEVEADLIDDLSNDMHRIIKEYEVAGLPIEKIQETIKESIR